MKKKLSLLTILCLCLPLAGCAPKEAAFAPPPCADVVTAIEEGGSFEELTALSAAQVEKFVGISQEQFADAAMSMDATRATPELILVLTARDEAGLKTLSDAVAAYRDGVLEEYRNYRPEELPKLENAVLRSKGLQTVLVVTGDPEAAGAALAQAWGEK